MQDKISADPRWKHQQIAPGVSRVPYDPDLPFTDIEPAAESVQRFFGGLARRAGVRSTFGDES